MDLLRKNRSVISCCKETVSLLNAKLLLKISLNKVNLRKKLKLTEGLASILSWANSCRFQTDVAIQYAISKAVKLINAIKYL